MKKPLAIRLLIYAFALSFGVHLYYLARHEKSTDYFIFQSNGLSWLFFTAFFAIATLDFFCFQLLARRDRLALRVGVISILISMALSTLTWTLAIKDLPRVKEAYIANRAERGVPVRRETADAVFTKGTTSLLSTMQLFLQLGLLATLLFSKRYLQSDVRATRRA
jgi:hypothetical protein